LELSDPAPTEISFAWNASWNLLDDAAQNEDVGLPTKLRARIRRGVGFSVHVEAYRDYRPAALLVPSEQLSRLDVDDEEIAHAALSAARGRFNAMFSCSWLDELRHRLRLRVYKCPAWGTGEVRERWARVDMDRWSIARSPRGLEVALESATGPHQRWEDTVLQWAELLSGSEAFDLFLHNNQVLDFLDTLAADGKLHRDSPLTVVHLDSHSDLWTFPDPTRYALNEDISDFLNAAILAGVVGEVYWVAPDWTRDEPFVDSFWRRGLPDTAEPYVSGPRTLEIFVDRDAGALYFGEPPRERPALPTVRFHKVLLSELPKLADRENLYLEVDGDYFSNVGFDTELQGHLNPDRGRMLAAFSSAARTLTSLGVRPRFTSWCLSPDYTAPEDELDQEYFFLSVLDRLSTDDYLIGYAHSEQSGRLPRAHNVRRQTPLHHWLLELRFQDYVRSNGDRRIELSGASDELDLAVKLASRRLGLSSEQGKRLLHRLDRFDGLTDQRVTLPDVEYYLSITEPVLPAHSSPPATKGSSS
jgi:hypothetical protein